MSMTADDRRRVREERDSAARQQIAYIGNGERLSAKKVPRLGADLTIRESQVLMGAMRGMTYSETAAWAGISESTAKQYSRSLLAKLGARTIGHAIAITCLSGDTRYAQTVARELRRLKVVA